MKKLVSVFILSFCIPLILLAQNKTIKGKVVDESGSPAASVTVITKGSKKGTSTDKDGNFSITVKEAGSVDLIFSSTEFVSKIVTTDGSSDVSVQLQRAVVTGEDVVVVGYQTVKRKDLTGAVSSVGAKQLKDVPENSAAEALTGRLAGLQITKAEGAPDADIQLKIRGGGSITQDNNPLYIVDGVQVENALNAISPQDIESIDVLKDAASTAIYGARGANGVVIITTKGGRNTKTSISYNGFYGTKKLANELEVMNPYDFVLYQYERSRGNSVSESSFGNTYGTTYDTLSVYKDAPFVNWQDEMFGRSAKTQTHSVAMTGGSATTTYNLSLTSNSEEGVMRNSDFDRKLVGFKFEHKASNKLKVSFSSRYNNTTVLGAGTASEGSSSTNRLRQVVKYRPLLLPGQGIDEYDDDYANETNGNSLSLINPILLNEAEYRRSYANTFNISGYANYSITKYLTFRSTVGYEYFNRRRNSFDDTITGNAKLNGRSMPIASINTEGRTTLTNSNVFTFTADKLKGKFNDRNELTVILGQEINEIKNKNYYIEGREFPVGITPDYAVGNMTLAQVIQKPTSSEITNKLLSFFGKVNYTLDKKYLFSFSARRDGSSLFAKGSQFQNFYAGSFAWKVINEKFMEKLSNNISDLKFRLSYGEAGNNRIPAFLYLTQYYPTLFYGLNDQQVTAYNPAPPGNFRNLANPDLKWETTVTKNLGVDIGFFKDRLLLSVDAYQNETKNNLVYAPLPAYNGYDAKLSNIGSTRNTGLEFQVTAVPVRNKNFNWNINLNISTNKNEILSLGPDQTAFLQTSGWGFSNTPADYIVQVGQALGSMYGFTTDGFYTIDQFDYDNGVYTLKTDVPSNLSVLSAPQPGALRFKDIDGFDAGGKRTGLPDGVINDADRSIIGVAQPKFFGGINQQISYKNFDFGVFVNFQVGNDVYNANKLEFTSGYTNNANLLAIANDRWRSVNELGQVVKDPIELATLNANAKLWTPSTSSNSFVLHSWAVEDGSFMRLNNITLGYTLPASLLKKMKIQRLRVYATGNNLAILTNYSGYDPEVNTRRGTPLTPGVDYSAYPRSRSFIFGVNVTL